MKLFFALALAFVARGDAALRTHRRTPVAGAHNVSSSSRSEPDTVVPTAAVADGLSAELRAAIAELETAVPGGDVASVERVTALLLEETRKRAGPKHSGLANVSSSSGANASAVAPAVMLKAAQKQAPLCLLDDYLFAMTPEAKAELTVELQDPKMVEAITWTKAGGWWTCANYGEPCKCAGTVRMVDVDHTAWSNVVDVRQTWNQITCDIASFGGVDVAVGKNKLCECAHAPDGSDYHLHKRLTSKSYTQEMWIFLLRLLGRTNLLPAGTGDRLYHGIENWAARRDPVNMPMVLERVWIEMFVKQVVLHHGPGPRCLEWGDPANAGAGFNYAFMLPQCTEPVDMQFDPVFYGLRDVGVQGNIVYSDIDRLPTVLQTGGDFRVNLILGTQVFEHIANPHYAAQMLFNSLLPGGALVFTAPQQAQFHLVPHDYFRYTKEGAVHTLQQAGFCVPKWAVAGGGDFVFDIARDAGLQVQDFPNEELTGAFQMGYDAVSDSAITIHAIGFKPPHAACATAMPAIYR